jgi:hypothetical protein
MKRRNSTTTPIVRPMITGLSDLWMEGSSWELGIQVVEVAWERVVKELGDDILEMIKVAVQLVVVYYSTDSDIAVEVKWMRGCW